MAGRLFRMNRCIDRLNVWLSRDEPAVTLLALIAAVIGVAS